MLSLAFILLALSSSCFAFDSVPAQLDRRSTVLADGTGKGANIAYGKLDHGLSWQSTGQLLAGGCTSGKQFITDCYQIYLDSNVTDQLQPGAKTPRQRTEFLNAHAADGTSWKFTYRSYIPSYDTGSTHFFHIMQIFSTAASGPVYTLDIQGTDTINFNDIVKGIVLATTPLSNFANQPLLHTLVVTYGPSGYLHYTVTNSQTGAVVLQYKNTDIAVGSGGTYLKFGMYRATFSGMPGVKAWYGDYTSTQL